MSRRGFSINNSRNIFSLACYAIKIIDQNYNLGKTEANLRDKILSYTLNDNEIMAIVNKVPKDGTCPNIFEILKIILKSEDKILFSREEIFNKRYDIIIIWLRKRSINKDRYESMDFRLAFSINIANTAMIVYAQDHKNITEWQYSQASHAGYIYCFLRTNPQNEETKEAVPSSYLISRSINHAPNTPYYQGLPNLGNTCYLNSVLQILKWTEGFASSIHLSKNPPIPQLRNVLLKMNTEENIEPTLQTLISSLNQHFQNFHLHTNHDAKELFAVFIDQIEENSINMFYIEFHRNFEKNNQGRIKIEKMTDKCPFIILPIADISNSDNKRPTSSQKFVSPSHDNDSYFTSLRRDAWIEEEKPLDRNRIKKSEKIKISTESISFPPNLAIYVPPWQSRNQSIKMEFTEEDNLYRLYGMIAYNPYILHYFSYICIENTWVKFDDEIVTYEEPRLELAYLLFYKAYPALIY